MAELSEWLQIMLAEIARKRDDGERAREEDIKRNTEKSSDSVDGTAQRRTPGNGQDNDRGATS
jgi:hypothetical protein